MESELHMMKVVHYDLIRTHLGTPLDMAKIVVMGIVL